MAFCSNCGTRLIEGAFFCPECGTKNTVAETMSNPVQDTTPQEIHQPRETPRNPVETPTQYTQARNIPPAPVEVIPQFPPVEFEIVEKETLKFLKVELENSAVRYESGGLYYMLGNLEMEAKMPSATGFLKSMVTKESAVKPVIRGSGTVWFEPTFGHFTILELNGEEWIADKGAYFASEMGIEIGTFTNKSFAGMFSGEGFYQTRFAGKGKVAILSNGPLETIELNNQKLVVDGSFAVAREAGVQMNVSRASKGMFSSMISGEGMISTFTGTGKVLIAPATNRYITMVNYLSSIHRKVSQLKSS